MSDVSSENVVVRWKRDPKIRAVAYKDLLSLKNHQVFVELLLALPWLIAEFVFIGFSLYIPAIFCAFMFFLTGLRQVHGGYHLSLGISKKKTDWFLFLMSGLMLGSMHAVKYNHLQHHKHCLDDDDIEAVSARMAWWKALLFGPLFPLMLHRQALMKGSVYYKRWIYGELVLNVSVVCAAVTLFMLYGSVLLLVHVGLMVVGQCLTAFFAVWTVHHDCDESDVFARTQRGWLKNFISYDMFYHVEHHLFPKVPQRNLPEIAKRLDGVVPELMNKRVF